MLEIEIERPVKTLEVRISTSISGIDLVANKGRHLRYFVAKIVKLSSLGTWRHLSHFTLQLGPVLIFIRTFETATSIAAKPDGFDAKRKPKITQIP